MKSDLGEKIILLRKGKGISQELLAENCKVSLRTIQRIESGSTTPRLFTLSNIANALGVSIKELSGINKSDANENDFNILRKMNLVSLAGIIIPLLNIFLPWLLWRRNGSQPVIKEVGRGIISFQILWTLTTLLALMIAQIIIGITGTAVVGKFPATLPSVYFLLGLTNIIFVLRASYKLGRTDSSIYQFVPKLI